MAKNTGFIDYPKIPGFIGYRIFLNDFNAWDGITTIEHSYKKPINLEAMFRRVVKIVRKYKLMEDVKGFALLNIDPSEELYLWRELTPHAPEWKFMTGRKEAE